jgi:hypothetical protein
MEPVPFAGGQHTFTVSLVPGHRSDFGPVDSAGCDVLEYAQLNEGGASMTAITYNLVQRAAAHCGESLEVRLPILTDR